MVERVARDMAEQAHAGQTNRLGEAVVAHLERVAAAVPPDACATAWLHDTFERTSLTGEEMIGAGASADELHAIELLSRAPGEPYELYISRIAAAEGEAGRLARVVKLADLDDHVPRTPAQSLRYVRARRRILWAQRRDLAVPDVTTAEREGRAVTTS